MTQADPASKIGRNAVILLGITQIIGYGTTYYCFGILADPVSAELGWSQSFYFGTLSAGWVASGLIASLVGKAFDRHGAARVMAAGSVLAGLGLIAMSQAHATWAFVLAMVGLQLAADLMLYNAAFTTLVQLSPQRGARRITYLTLIAGFASTIFWPLTSWLSTEVGWRVTLMIFASLNLLISFPLHVLVSRWVLAAQASIVHGNPHSHKEGSITCSQYAKAMFLMLAGFMLSSITLSAVLAMMVPLFEDMGFGAASLAVGMLFGPAQVLVRLGHMIVGENQHPLRTTIFALSLLPVGLLVGLVFAPSLAAAVVMVVLIGLCSGLKSIVQGALPLHLFGSEGFGARLGVQSSFRYVAAALAPFGFTFVSEVYGTETAVAGLIAIGAMGVACFAVLQTTLLRRDAGAAAEPHT